MNKETTYFSKENEDSIDIFKLAFEKALTDSISRNSFVCLVVMLDHFAGLYEMYRDAICEVLTKREIDFKLQNCGKRITFTELGKSCDICIGSAQNVVNAVCGRAITDLMLIDLDLKTPSVNTEMMTRAIFPTLHGSNSGRIFYLNCTK